MKNSIQLHELYQISEKWMAAIKLRDYEQVERELSLWPTDGKAHRRMQGHMLGKIELLKGNYSAAVQILQTTIESEGSHLLLYADLVASLFLSRQYSTWRLATEELDQLLGIYGEKVHETSRLRAQIVLGNAFEYQGKIRESYRLFLQIAESKNVYFRVKALCNLVRLEAQFSLSTEFGEHYQILKQYSYNTEQPDYDFEVMQALLISEGAYLSVDVATETLLQIPRDCQCFFAFGFYELLEIWLKKSKTALVDLISRVGAPPKAISFANEKLLQLADRTDTGPIDWYAWPQKMPHYFYFRMLPCLLARLDATSTTVCLQQVALLLTGYSGSDRKIWLDYFKKWNIEFQQELQIQWQEGLTVNEIKVGLGRQKLVRTLVSMVIEKKSISLSDACVNLWNSPLDDSYRNRLRQLIIRINRAAKKDSLTEILKVVDEKIVLVS